MKTISRLLSLIGMTFVLATTNPIYAGGNCQECDLLKDWKDFYSEILLDIQKKGPYDGFLSEVKKLSKSYEIPLDEDFSKLLEGGERNPNFQEAVYQKAREARMKYHECKEDVRERRIKFNLGNIIYKLFFLVLFPALR
ncbi:MAG: hypothetical protein ABIJ14_03315 [Nanoarchaeota archaeon]